EIGLHQGTVGNRGVVQTTTHGPELMHPTITCAVSLELETHLTDRAKLFFKDWHDVLPAEAMRYQTKLRVFCRLRNRVARVRNDIATRSTQHQMGMTNETLISIVTGTQSIGIGARLREHGIQFAWHRRTFDYVGALVARRLQLTSTPDSFFERSALVIV